jgi:iron complex outermembrane receptor protein
MSSKMRNGVKYAVLSTTIAAASMAAQSAHAQQAVGSPAAATEAQAATTGAGGGDIVVTARKQSESILKTPLAVSALDSKGLAVRGVVTLNDLSASTPGLNVNNNAASRNDRSFQQLIIRGFTPSQATNPTAALFIDGAPVSSTSAFSTISDPARVEVLKGPQSAYFGRNTFAGAINFVNKVPDNDLSGSVAGMIGTRNNYRLHADVGGALVTDVILFRLNVDRFSKSGSWRNGFSGETLGDQQTTSGSGFLVIKPSDNLTIKGFGLVSQDKDGAPAQGLISAVTLRDSNGKVVAQSQSNCTLSGMSAAGVAISNPFICGIAPALANGPSANTTEDTFIKNFLASPTGRLIAPKDGVQGYGLKRNYYHLHGSIDYELPDMGLTLSSLTAYNNEKYSQLSDIDNYGSVSIPNNGLGPVAAGARSYFDYPYFVERINRDFSQEFRVSYDQGGKFHAMLGGSYLNAFSQGGLGGGNGALGTTVFSAASGATRAKTFGAFFGATYKFTPAFSLSLEGRYQIDTLSAYAQPNGLVASTSIFVPAGTYAGNQKILQATYRNFLPRVIAQYDVAPNLMAYASFSKGVNPGQFNTAFLTFSAPLQRAAAAAGLGVRVDPEKVDNYEIGFKGKLFDNSVTFALAAYYAPWRNQINALTITQFDPVTNTVQIVRAAANTGSIDMKGIELEGTYHLSRAIDINFSGAVNDSSINSYRNAQVSQLTGITNFRGKENPNTSKYSANLGVQYNGEFSGGSTWFVRSDYSFKSGVWSDAANTVRTRDLHLVNLRAGVDVGPVSISAWVRNVFDNHTYTSISNTSVLSNNFAYSTYFSGVIVGLPELRTFGLEGKFRF